MTGEIIINSSPKTPDSQFFMWQAETKTSSLENSISGTGIKPALRVLVIAPSPDVVGGQSIQAKRILDAFAGETEIKIGFLATNPGFKGFLKFSQRVKYVRTIFTLLKFGYNLLKTIPQYDVVQAFSASNTSYVVSTLPPLFVAKLCGKKIILNYHSGEAGQHIRRWSWLTLPTLRRFDEIVVPSEFLVDVFAEFSFKAQAIHNFVDGEKFAFRRREKLKPVFLSNRNLEAHYNVGCILRAFALIQKQYPEAKLFIAGDGCERNKLEKLASDLSLKNVEFLGSVPHDEIPEFFNRADIYLNSSVVDNMPLSIIEAFSCGVPVVTTDAGGIPYIVRHEETGLKVESGDCEALASEAVRLLKDENLAQNLIENARRACETNYSWKSVKGKWTTLYLKLGERNRRRVLAAIAMISYHYDLLNLVVDKAPAL